jgi:hypothetical protein
MIKECKVLSYNKFLHILVFDYDGKQIQTTAILDTECKTVFVKYKDGKYEVVSKNEYDKYIRNLNKKKIETPKIILEEKLEEVSE